VPWGGPRLRSRLRAAWASPWRRAPTLSAELQRWPLPAQGYVSRVLLDQSRRADHVRGVRKPRLLVSSLACAALGTVVLAAAACGTTTSPTPTPADSSTPPATPSETATPTSTADPTDAAILNAYDQAVTAWFAAAADPGAQDPGIVEWYTGVALTLAQGRLGALQQSDWVVAGTYTPHPVVTNLDGGTAAVQDCGWNATYVADEGTTTAVSSEAGAPTMPFNETVAARMASGSLNFTATMVLQSGTWRLSEQLLEVTTPCTAASPSA